MVNTKVPLDGLNCILFNWSKLYVCACVKAIGQLQLSFCRSHLFCFCFILLLCVYVYKHTHTPYTHSHVCVCVCIIWVYVLMYGMWVHMYVQVQVCAGHEDSRSCHLGVFLYCSPLYFLREDLSWDTGFTHQLVFGISATTYRALGLPLSRHACFVCRCQGFKLWSLWHWAISPACSIPVLSGEYDCPANAPLSIFSDPLHRFIQFMHYPPISKGTLRLCDSHPCVLPRLVLLNGYYSICSRGNLIFSVLLLFQLALTLGVTVGRKLLAGFAPLQAFYPWSFILTAQ